MSDLMLDRGLLTSREGSQSRAIARTLTRGVLRRLDGQRKGLVVQFLSESRLIDPKKPKVSMRGADLRGVTIQGRFADTPTGGDRPASQPDTQSRLDDH
jgi:hypothetical protein